MAKIISISPILKPESAVIIRLKELDRARAVRVMKKYYAGKKQKS